MEYSLVQVVAGVTAVDGLALPRSSVSAVAEDELDELLDDDEGRGDADADAPLVEAQPGRVEDPLEEVEGR